MEFKGTKGEATLGDENNQHAEVAIKTRLGDLTIVFDRRDRHSNDFIISRDEMLANAHLTIDSITTANKCNLLPSELLDQRDKAIGILRTLIHKIEFPDRSSIDRVGRMIAEPDTKEAKEFISKALNEQL